MKRKFVMEESVGKPPEQFKRACQTDREAN